MNVGLKASRASLKQITTAWSRFRDRAAIGVIRDEKHYAQMVSLANQIIDEIGSDEDHELAKLLELVGALIEQYEKDNVAVGNTSPREVLQFLMEQHDLKQDDLRAEVGTQGVVSEVLRGKRELNARQVRALAKRFGVSPAVFI